MRWNLRFGLQIELSAFRNVTKDMIIPSWIRIIEIDGGVYDNPDIGIREALQDIVDDLKQNPNTNGAKGNIAMEDELIPLDYDEVAMEAEETNRVGSAVYDSRGVMEFKAKTEAD